MAYESFKEDYTEPCIMQKNLQLWESVFESMPQLILQTVFLIKTYNLPTFADDNSMTLVILSIIASTISVVTKYMWYDRSWVHERAQDVHLKHKNCTFPFCISWSYIARIVWRFSELMLRFIIFCLLWVVCGGVYLTIYVICSFIIYFVLEYYTKCTWITIYEATRNDIAEGLGTMLILILQSLVGIPLRRHLKMNLIRFVDNLIVFFLILSIATRIFGTLECDSDFFCNNTSNKYANDNAYVFVLLVIGGIALVLEIVIYLSIYFKELVVTEMKTDHGNAYKSRHGAPYELGKQEELLRRFHPMFLKRALADLEQQKMKETTRDDCINAISGRQIPRMIETSVTANDIEIMSFGKDLEEGDVLMNAVSGFTLPIAKAHDLSALRMETAHLPKKRAMVIKGVTRSVSLSNTLQKKKEPMPYSKDDSFVNHMNGLDAANADAETEKRFKMPKVRYTSVGNNVHIPKKKEVTKPKSLPAIPKQFPVDFMYSTMFDAVRVQAPAIKSIDVDDKSVLPKM